MRYTTITFATLFFGTAVLWSCQSGTTDKAADEPLVKAAMTKEETVKHGKYIVEIGGCNDCHSPKKMTAHGPAVDSSRMLSGHPEGSPLPPVLKSALQPGNWVLMSPDVTAFVGPWGISYSANLTSDSATGIGAWTEGQFIQTMRTGKHLGLEGGRPVMPPMPWEAVGKMSDDDLKAMLAYLKSVPPIKNRVPGPVPPDQAAAK
jgi:mono/diheme cytochrome c family protein